MELYTDDNGNRVIIRHVGPPGRGLIPGGTPGQILSRAAGPDYSLAWVNPPDGTGAVVGPASATANAIALFDGTTGKLVKDSGVLLASLATTASVDLKVDRVTGKGLSTNDLTNGFNFILTTLNAQSVALGKDPSAGSPAFALSGFRGNYATLMALTTAVPVGNAGDYAYIEVFGSPSRMYIWSTANTAWQAYDSNTNLTGSQIATLLFSAADSPSYVQSSTRIFTTDYLALIEQHESIISSVTGELSAVITFGSIAYFSTTGTSVSIASISDGLTNMVKAVVATAASVINANFDNGGADDGRIRYTAAVGRTCSITAKVSVSGAANDQLVIGLAKNGSVVLASRVLVTMNAAGDTQSVTLTGIVPLTTTDFIEVYVGNTDSVADPTFQVLTIEALAI